MANSSMMIGFGFILIAGLVAMNNSGVEAGITCNVVLTKLSPCLPFLKNGGANPGPGCCGGAKSLYAQAATPPDRQAVCRCIKTIAPGVGAHPANINAIPSKCQINIPYRYSPALNCNTVH